METKLVYVLASDEKDVFTESALISIFSARKHMPSAHIVLAVDDCTDATLRGSRAALLDFVSEKRVAEFPEGISKKVRSRLLKIRSRQMVNGPMLYLDCDTMVVRDLSSIDSCQYDVAAVIDGHCPFVLHPCKKMFQDQASVIGESLSSSQHLFNGGVLWASDTMRSTSLFSRWEKEYERSLAKGLCQDQPALWRTDRMLGSVVGELPGVWNCQLRLGPLFLHEAKIIHFVSKRSMPLSWLGSREFLMTVKDRGLDAQGLQRGIDNYLDTMIQPLGLIAGRDVAFNFTSQYENVLNIFTDSNEET